MLFSFAETSFSAAQNRSKRTGGAMVSNATNATTAAGNSMAASAFKTTNFGQPIAQANKRPRSLPSSMDAAAKPSIAAYKRRKSERTIRSPNRPTSSSNK